MRVFGAVILTMTLSIPSALFAEEEGIRASAIRLAEAEGRAVQQSGREGHAPVNGPRGPRAGDGWRWCGDAVD